MNYAKGGSRVVIECFCITQAMLDEIVEEHERMMFELQEPVGESLEKLRGILLLLQNISDLQHVVDEKFLPVEEQYAMLRLEAHLVLNKSLHDGKYIYFLIITLHLVVFIEVNTF